MNLAIFDSLISLVDKLLPDGTAKLQVKLAIEEARSKLKQPLTLSIIAVLWILIYQGKAIIYRIQKIVYFNTYEWWVDVVILAVILGFLFSVPFSELLKAYNNKPK